VAAAKFDAFSRHLPGQTEGGHEEPQSGQSVSVHAKYQAVRSVLSLRVPRQGSAAHILFVDIPYDYCGEPS